jgi:hypothetical protein
MENILSAFGCTGRKRFRTTYLILSEQYHCYRVWYLPEPGFLTFKELRNRFQGIDSTSVCSMAESNTWNRFLGPLKVYKLGLWVQISIRMMRQIMLGIYDPSYDFFFFFFFPTIGLPILLKDNRWTDRGNT